MRQVIAEDQVGDGREPERRPTTVEIPNLRVTFAEATAQTWVDWFDDFVVRGRSGDVEEKSGSIVFLAPNLTDELGRVTLENVGIFSLGATPAESGSETIRRLAADLYVERMGLQIGPAG